MASSETSRLLRGGTPHNKRAHFVRPSTNRADSEAESSLSTSVSQSPSSLCSDNDDSRRRRTGLLPISELTELLTTLEAATAAVKEQLRYRDNTDPVIGRRRRRQPLIPHCVTNYLLLMTFLAQTLCVALIAGIEELAKKEDRNSSQTSKEIELTGNILLTVLQAAHLILVFFVSFKVVKQVMHRTASGSLVAQSYLSTVLLFAGLYTLIYRLQPAGWKRVSEGNVSSPILLFLRMLFFSVSTATLCGTSVIEPIEWYTDVVVGVQMLTSFVYFTSIMSVALTPRRKSQFDSSSSHTSKSFTRRIRRVVFGKRDNYDRIVTL